METISVNSPSQVYLTDDDVWTNDKGYQRCENRKLKYIADAAIKGVFPKNYPVSGYTGPSYYHIVQFMKPRNCAFYIVKLANNAQSYKISSPKGFINDFSGSDYINNENKSGTPYKRSVLII
jgi:hypothetical protein